MLRYGLIRAAMLVAALVSPSIAMADGGHKVFHSGTRFHSGSGFHHFHHGPFFHRFNRFHSFVGFGFRPFWARLAYPYYPPAYYSYYSPSYSGVPYYDATQSMGYPPGCREFTADVNIGGTVQPAYGIVCPQPDGSWRIVQ